MGIPARQSTARTVIIGPVLDSSGAAVTDGVVGDFKVSKNGAAPAALNGSATLTHRHTGHYSLALTASDLDTVGTAQVTIDDTTNTCGRVDLDVIEEPVYDALFAASANAFTGAAGSSAVTALASGAITEASFATTAGSFIPLGILDQGTAQSATSTTVRLRAGATFAADDIKDSIILVKGSDQDRWQTGRICTDYDAGTKDATVDPAFTTPPTGTISYIVVAGAADLSTPPAVNVTQLGGSATPVTNMTTVYSTDFANNYNTTDDAWAVKLKDAVTHGGSTAVFQMDTAEVGGDDLATVANLSGTTFTSIPWNAAWDAEVQSECADALAAYDPPTKAELDAAESNIRGADSDTLKTLSDQVDGLSTSAAPQLLLNTTIATLASQTSFTLTAGSPDDDAYNGAVVVVTDQSTSTQKAVGLISDYAGGTRAVTLSADPAVFTMAVGDTVDVLANITSAPTVTQIRQEIDSNSTQLAAIVADTGELQTDWANGGRLDVILDARASQTSVDAVAADLPQRVTKNTALAGFPFKLVSSSDHVTAVTGATVTATRSLDGAAFAACANSASEVASGWYKIDLAAGDLNGNTVVLRFTASGADAREYVIVTQPT